MDTLWAAGWAITIAGLCGYGLHRYYLLFLFFRHRGNRPPPRAAPRELPAVTVQLPIYNEGAVVERLFSAVAALDYPRERLEIQILDDSTDETRDLCREAATRLEEAGFDVDLWQRDGRTGFKAGALAEGHGRAKGEFLLVLDADFVPPPDVLMCMLGHFSDPGTGMVQARWGYLNREDSLLTKLQAVILDGHFLIEQVARSRSGRFFAFNGTGGIWRRSCIEEAGGWQADTLTEDLDLSYRAQLAGWKFVYLEEVVIPGELPGNMAAYQSQQHRWVKGAVETLKKLLPQILTSGLPLRTKLEAVAHLSGNLAYLLMGLLFVLLWPREGTSIQGEPTAGAITVAVFLLAFVSVGLFYLCALRLSGAARRPGDYRIVALVLAAGAGMSVNGIRAVAEALSGRVSPFVRTPKSGDRMGRGARGPVVQRLFETVLAIYFGVLAVVAARGGDWLGIAFLLIFVLGFAYVAVLSRASPKGGPGGSRGLAAKGADECRSNC